MTRLLALLTAGLLLSGCPSTPTPSPAHSFDHPADTTLVCAKLDQTGQVETTLPLDQCKPPATAPLVGIEPRLFLLVSNGARGEVAFVSAGKQDPVDTTDAGVSVIDLDRNSPGYNFLPVGSQPAPIRASADGCVAATANLGSCDLSVMTVRKVLTQEFGPDGGPDGVPPLISAYVNRVQPNVALTTACMVDTDCGAGQGCFVDWQAPAGSGGHCGIPLGARPTWLEMSPGSDVATDETGASECRTNYHVMAAFPGCELVAEIDLGDGHVLQAARVTTSGPTVLAPADLLGLRCESECHGTPSQEDVLPSDAGQAAPNPEDLAVSLDAGVTATMGAVDGGTISDGGNSIAPTGLPPIKPTTQAMPQTLAIDDDLATNRAVFVGDGVSDRISVLPLDAAGQFQAGFSFELAPNAQGVSRLRISPRLPSLALPGDPGGGPRFLYAVAADRSVRVIDADRAGAPATAAAAECETNPDPAYVNSLCHASSDGKTIACGPAVNTQAFPGSAVSAIEDDFSNGTPSAGVAHSDVESQLRCLPVGPTPRSPLAQGPGIFLPGFALPRDVSFTHHAYPLPAVSPETSAQLAAPGLLVGDFAWIIDSAGHTNGANLADLCPQPNDPSPLIPPPPSTSGVATPINVLQPCDPERFRASVAEVIDNPGSPAPLATDLLPHKIRMAFARFVNPTNFGDPGGSPRFTDLPQQVVIAVDSTTPATVDVTVAPNLCNFAAPDGGVATTVAVSCTSEPQEIEGANFVTFRDPTRLTDEDWTIGWEGTVPGTIRAGGTLVGALLSDPSGAFCTHDVHDGDKVFLNGCIDDTGCTPEEECYLDPERPPDSTRGMCFSRDALLFINAQTCCTPWTQSVPRYHVAAAFQDHLVLDEIPLPEHPSDTRECEGPADPCSDVQVFTVVNGEPATLSTACLPDGTGKNRCLRACVPSDNTLVRCGSGFTCGFVPSVQDYRCIRAPLPPTDSDVCAATGENLRSLCFPELQQYEVHAGESFVVSSSITGYYSASHPDANNACVPPSPASPERLLTGRIPIAPPLCPDPVQANWLTFIPDGFPAACRLAPPPSLLDQTFLRFDNPLFGLVVRLPAGVGASFLDGGLGDAFVDGGQVGGAGNPDSIVDPQAGLAGDKAALLRAPLVPPEGSAITFSTTGGFHPFSFPLGVDVSAQLPRSVVTGPDGTSLYVVDEGAQMAPAGLRGQVLRFLTNFINADFTLGQVNDSNFLVR